MAVVLLIVVAFNAAFNAWQDFSTGRVLDSITGMIPAEVTVLRNGASARIPSADLVPGDIVDLTLGQKVPADLRLINVSSDLKFDRSILTGESDPIDAKVDDNNHNFLESERALHRCIERLLTDTYSQEHRNARNFGHLWFWTGYCRTDW